MKRIAFDIDGTLFNLETVPKPREDVLALLRAFHKLGWAITIHSGGGIHYAEGKVYELGLDKEMHITLAAKGSPDYIYDIAVDDMPLEEDNLLAIEQGREYRIKAKHFIQV